ncbi:hypothetical protein ACLB1E_08410 [Escherichia coli]
MKQVLVDLWRRSGTGRSVFLGMGLPIAITCFRAGSCSARGWGLHRCLLTAVGLVMPVIEQLELLRCADGGAVDLYRRWFVFLWPRNDAGFWLLV